MDEYLLDTKWACGLIVVRDGKIVDGATIFRKLFGQSIDKISKVYKVTKLEGKWTHVKS